MISLTDVLLEKRLEFSRPLFRLDGARDEVRSQDVSEAEFVMPDKETIVVGRINSHSKVDFKVREGNLAERQFAISNANGSYFIENMDPNKGTYLEGEPLELGQTSLVKTGSIIFAGSKMYRVRVF